MYVTRSAILSQVSSEWRSCLRPRSYFHVSLTTRAAAFMIRCNLSVTPLSCCYWSRSAYCCPQSTSATPVLPYNSGPVHSDNKCFLHAVCANICTKLFARSHIHTDADNTGSPESESRCIILPFRCKCFRLLYYRLLRPENEEKNGSGNHLFLILPT